MCSWNDGTGNFTRICGAHSRAVQLFDDLAIGDFNADGKSDFAVVRSAANVVHVLQGDGTGHFSITPLCRIPGVPVSVVAKDLNGDGKPDIAVTIRVTDNIHRQYGRFSFDQ